MGGGFITKVLSVFAVGFLISYCVGAYLNDGSAAIFTAICFYGALLFTVLSKFVNANLLKNDAQHPYKTDDKDE